jgi:hypothetical protein
VNNTVSVKPSGAMIALGCITLVLSAYGLYGLMHDYAAMPAVLAALAIAGLDLFALAAGKHAIDLAKDGDSPAAWNLLVILVGLVSAVAQYAHMALAGAPWIAGVIFAMFPIATVILFEGSLRRAARLNGRETGRVAPARATFELLQWLVYRKATARAFRLAVADRELSADGAFKIGLMTVAAENVERAPAARRQVTIPYAQLLGVPLAITDGEADTSAQRPDLGGGQPVSVAELVRRAMSEGADNADAVLAHVRTVKPDASAEAVRKAYGRELGKTA